MLHFARLPMVFGVALVGTAVLGALGVRAALHSPAPIPAVTIAPIAVADLEINDLVAASDTTIPDGADDFDEFETRPTLDPADFAFVVTVAGVSYVQLATPDSVDVDIATIKQGRAKLVVDKQTWVTSAIATVLPSALPEPLRRWSGRKVTVGGTCTATVVGFAMIARVTGEPDYAGTDARDWTVDSVTASGSTMIAARLDGCAGGWARDAARPAVAIGVPITTPRATQLAAAAQADLFTSEVADTADASWNDPAMWSASTDDEAPADWRTTATITNKVVEHAATHEHWIVVHARVAGGCGDRSVNLVGIYREDPANPGTVVRVRTADSGITSIDGLLDVDQDGWFELLVTEGYGPTRSLRDLDDTTLDASSIQFYGCPC